MISDTLIQPWIEEGHLKSERLARHYRALNATAKDLVEAVQPNRWSETELYDDAQRRHDEAHDALDMLELETDERAQAIISTFKCIIKAYRQYRLSQNVADSPVDESEKGSIMARAHEARGNVINGQAQLLKLMQAHLHQLRTQSNRRRWAALTTIAIALPALAAFVGAWLSP